MAESALRREKRRERAAAWGALAPAQRLRRAALLTRAARALRAAGRASLVRERAPGPDAGDSPFKELGDVLALLTKLRVPHALIGGGAVVASGAFRTSDDIDLLADFTVPQRKSLLEGLSARYEAEWLAPEDLVAMKLQAGGGQDYVDARSLLALPGGLDEDLLESACRERRVLDRLALIRPR